MRVLLGTAGVLFACFVLFCAVAYAHAEEMVPEPETTTVGSPSDVGVSVVDDLPIKTETSTGDTVESTSSAVSPDSVVSNVTEPTVADANQTLSAVTTQQTEQTADNTQIPNVNENESQVAGEVNAPNLSQQLNSDEFSVDETQWSELVSLLKTQNTLLLLVICGIAAVLGSNVAPMLVKGWRR